MEVDYNPDFRGSPRVSVVIPTFNRAHTVLRAIRSVIGQSFTEWEAIVIDDGSVDDTLEVVKAIRDNRIRYIRHKQNAGHSAARNTGIRAARGAYISFLDSDDEWMPEKLALEVALFELSPAVGLIYSGEEVLEREGRLVERDLPVRQGIVFRDLLQRDFIGSCSRVAVRKRILEAVGGFDEDLSNEVDWDLWLRVARSSEVACIAPLLVRRHLESKRVSGNLKAICESRLKIVEKHRDEMSSQTLGKHLATLAIILFNYDTARARALAFQSRRLGRLHIALLAASFASCFGLRIYRQTFAATARLLHGGYIGRAKL